MRSQGWARTEHARRYLAQLCQHFAEHTFAHHPDDDSVAHRDDRSAAHRNDGLTNRDDGTATGWDDGRSGDQGFLDFGWGTCRLAATPDGLLLDVVAADEPGLARIEYLLSDHIERFGSAESLSPQWRRVDHVDHAATPSGRSAPSNVSKPSGPANLPGPSAPSGPVGLPAPGGYDHRTSRAIVQAAPLAVHDQGWHDQAEEYAPQRGTRHADAAGVRVRDTPDPGQPHPRGLGEQPDEEAVHGDQHDDRGPAVAYRIGEDVREE